MGACWNLVLGLGGGVDQAWATGGGRALHWEEGLGQHTRGDVAVDGSCLRADVDHESHPGPRDPDGGPQHWRRGEEPMRRSDTRWIHNRRADLQANDVHNDLKSTKIEGDFLFIAFQFACTDLHQQKWKKPLRLLTFKNLLSLVC